MTFHLPMEIDALRAAGADEAQVDACVSARLTEAFAEGLVDPPLYRWAVTRYTAVAEQLVSADQAERCAALQTVEPLADGLAGAALHGLIRLGYGAWRRNAAEVARGLAYLRTRRQVLLGPAAAGALVGSDDVPDFVDSGATIFEQLNVVAGSGLLGTLSTARPVDAVAQAATALVRRNPSSFVAVHAVTSLHALCELDARITGGRDIAGHDALAPWWRALDVAHRACTVIVEALPPESPPPYADRFGPAHTIDDVCAAALHTGDTHDVKLAVALRRLVDLGLVAPADAVEVGQRRLAAGRGRD